MKTHAALMQLNENLQNQKNGELDKGNFIVQWAIHNDWYNQQVEKVKLLSKENTKKDPSRHRQQYGDYQRERAWREVEEGKAVI